MPQKVYRVLQLLEFFGAFLVYFSLLLSLMGPVCFPTSGRQEVGGTPVSQGGHLTGSGTRIRRIVEDGISHEQTYASITRDDLVLVDLGRRTEKVETQGNSTRNMNHP